LIETDFSILVVAAKTTPAVVLMLR